MTSMTYTKRLIAENRSLRRRLSLALTYLSAPETNELLARLAGQERRHKWAQAYLTPEDKRRITIPVRILPPVAPANRMRSRSNHP